MTLKPCSAVFNWALIILFVGGIVSPSFAADATFLTWSNIGLGYGSGINTSAFRHNSLVTVGNYQFATYYEPNDGNNSNGVNDGVIIVARRTLGGSTWSTYRTSFKAVDITDGHDTISYGIDGNGLMHMSWGMHNNPLLYTTSTASVLNDNPINFYSTKASSMPISAPVGGYTSEITYPQFYNIPGSGDLLFWYRVGGAGGGSGNGNLNLNRYSAATGTWSEVKAPVLDGITNSLNAYPNTMVIDNQGNYQISWTWRATPDYQTNHDVDYAQSTNGGTAWTSITGAAINSPASAAITVNSPNQTVAAIPTGSSLMNQCDMTDDLNGRPLIATYWAPGGDTNSTAARQYMLVYYDGAQWRTSQITNRPSEPKITNNSSSRIGEMGRPRVLVDQDGRTFVVMRYTDISTSVPNNPQNNHITVAYSTDKQNWSFLDLTPTTNMGGYEPLYDPEIWRREGILDLFYEQGGQASSMVSVLEWNELHNLRSITTVDWTGGNGNWNLASNWTNSALPPDGKWTNVRFGNQSGHNDTVDMSSAGRTVGNITFTSTNNTTTIQGSSLVLDNSGSDSTIAVAGNHTISAPLILNNNLDITGTGALNLSGGISGNYDMSITATNLTAKSISGSTLTQGSGTTLTIQAIPGGLQGGNITPVPEPSTLVLLAIGAFFIMGYSWQRWVLTVFLH
jgi:hypothetical protein